MSKENKKQSGAVIRFSIQNETQGYKELQVVKSFLCGNTSVLQSYITTEVISLFSARNFSIYMIYPFLIQAKASTTKLVKIPLRALNS